MVSGLCGAMDIAQWTSSDEKPHGLVNRWRKKSDKIQYLFGIGIFKKQGRGDMSST